MQLDSLSRSTGVALAICLPGFHMTAAWLGNTSNRSIWADYFFFFFKFLFLFLFLFLYLFSFSYFSFLLEDTMWNIIPHLKLCTNITRGLALFYSLNLSSPSFLFIPRIFTEQNHAVLRFIYFFFLRLAKNCL